MEEVKALQPDVIAFQEANKQLVQYLTQLDWIRKSYYLFDVDGT